MRTKMMTITSMDDAGKGLAELATLSAVDHDGDTYAPGAFAWKDGGHQWAMMQPAHDRRKMPFGKARVYEDAGKAMAELHLNLNTEAGREWHAALKFDFEVGNPVQEWSYGYTAIDAEFRIQGEDRVRVLKKLDVDEVSPVLRGAGVGTRTVAMKGAAISGAQWRDQAFAPLLAELGEMATAVDLDPAILSATGLKQLREIDAAIARVLGTIAAEAKANGLSGAVADAELARFLRFQSRRHLAGE